MTVLGRIRSSGFQKVAFSIKNEAHAPTGSASASDSPTAPDSELVPAAPGVVSCRTGGASTLCRPCSASAAKRAPYAIDRNYQAGLAVTLRRPSCLDPLARCRWKLRESPLSKS